MNLSESGASLSFFPDTRNCSQDSLTRPPLWRGKLPFMTDIRFRLDALALALRHLHSALLDHTKNNYEFLNGKIASPYTLYNLVTSDPSFQWLRPLSGLMATLDEVIDQKDTPLTERHFQDVKQAYHLLFSQADTRFMPFRDGYEKAKDIPAVREAYQKVHELLESHEA